MANHPMTRLPYVWDGNITDLAVFIDGCYRSAQIDREESDLFGSVTAKESCLASAADWEARAQAVERNWLTEGASK